MSGFDAYRKQPRQRAGGCRICGEPTEGRVVITLQERRPRPERSVKEVNRFEFPSINSNSASFCEKHAIETYEAARKALAR